MAANAESSNSGRRREDLEWHFSMFSSDFATIATTPSFIDNTLMIRNVYNVSTRILITAPRKFGKTTNMDMVKRFFEITVDDASGKAKAVDTTENYRLFKDNNLEISKDADFFNEHFGKHPVLHIDFKPLDGVTDFGEMIDAFKDIVTDSFGQHRYLLKNPLTKAFFVDVFGFDENCLTKLFHNGLIKDVDTAVLAKSFKYLSASLYKNFGKKVIVLMDNYDAYFGSLLFKGHEDAEKIISFLHSSIRSVLNDKSVERVLITGVLPVMDGVLPSDVYSIDCYQFLDSHPFTKYYGLMCDNFENFLTKLTTSDGEKCSVKNVIDNYYEAYTSRRQGVKVYNAWSVLQYLRKRTVQSYWCQSYWCQSRYVKRFDTCFKIPKIREKLEELLIFDDMQFLDELQPLSVDDVFKLNKLITGDTNIGCQTVQLFLILFWHIGYLSLNDSYKGGRVHVKVATEEIKFRLVKFLFDVNSEAYKLSSYGLPELGVIYPAINGIWRYGNGVEEKIENFITTINWHRFNISDSATCTSLFMIFLTDYNGISRPIVCRRSQCSDGRPVILLKNVYNVAICITYSSTTTDSQYACRIVSEDKRIFDVFDDIVFNVIIAIDKEHRCTYFVGDGDSFGECKTIELPH